MPSALSGITSMAARHILDDLSQIFESKTGITISFAAAGGVEAAQRVRQGLPVDVVALAAGALQTLERDGHIVSASRVDYASSGIALAVPADAPLPDIATADNVRSAMLGAARVAYSTGPSGEYLKSLWEKWGIAGDMARRAVIAPTGVPVAALLARGDADLGFQQASELMGQPGIAVVGMLPESIQQFTIFSAALAAKSANPKGAIQFLAFLREPDAHGAIVRRHMNPIDV